MCFYLFYIIIVCFLKYGSCILLDWFYEPLTGQGQQFD